MSSEGSNERLFLVELVERLVHARFSSDDEADQLIADLAARVPHPNPLGLIYYWEDDFDIEPTAEEMGLPRDLVTGWVWGQAA